jgi:hypothetical protein
VKAGCPQHHATAKCRLNQCDNESLPGGGETTIVTRENEEENEVVAVTLFHPKRFRCRVSGDKAYVRWLSNFFMTHILLSSSPNT